MAEVAERPKQIGVLVGEALNLSLSAKVRACELIAPVVGTHNSHWFCGLDTMQRVRHSGGQLPIRDALIQAARARVAADYTNPGVSVAFTTRVDGRCRPFRLGVRVRSHAQRVTGLSLECVEPTERRRWSCTMQEALGMLLQAEPVGDIGVTLWAFTEYMRSSAQSLLRSVRVMGNDMRPVKPQVSDSLIDDLLRSGLGLRTAFGIRSASRSLEGSPSQTIGACKIVHAKGRASARHGAFASEERGVRSEAHHVGTTGCDESCAVCARRLICNACVLEQQSPGAGVQATSTEWAFGLADGVSTTRDLQNIEHPPGNPSTRHKHEQGVQLYHPDIEATILGPEVSPMVPREHIKLKP